MEKQSGRIGVEQSAKLPDENRGLKAVRRQHTAESKTARKSVEKSCCHKLPQFGHYPTPGSALGVLLLFSV